METIKITVYPFSELNEAAKKQAIEKFADINVDWNGWSEGTIDDAKECGKLLGIDIDTVYFSGFSSQGDGACFEGDYTYRKNAVKAIKTYAPKDTVLHSIAERLQAEQKSHLYKITANVKHSGRYYHSRCTDITVKCNDDEPKNAEDVRELLREFMQWIYNQLETQYDYLTNETQVIETIEANEYRFLESGKLFIDK